MSPLPGLDRVVIVLAEPRLAINIGTVARAMKNMGLTRLRLVNPAEMDLDRALLSGHRTQDIIDSMGVFESLDAAVADCHRVVGLTARPRRHEWVVSSPREEVPELLERLRDGEQVAFLFGREQSGLTNEELERCDTLLTVPTRPDYASLNLAQAVLIMSYELFLGAGASVNAGQSRQEGPAKVREALAPLGDRGRLLAQIRHTLAAIGFFQTSRPGVMHSVAQILSRASLDRREVRMMTGIFAEVLKFAHLLRRGIVPDGLPDAPAPSVSQEDLEAMRVAGDDGPSTPRSDDD